MIEVPVLVKEALREGSLLKEYNFTVYEVDGETVDFVINNDNLVSESVKFDERMCSDTNLKFGLCEGTSLEFQVFEIPNITGRRIYAVVKAQYKNEQGSLAWYSIPMGWFTVEETSRQASTGIRKISAYNKLKSDYLDAKANTAIEEEFSSFDEVYTIDVIDDLLEGYGVDRKITSTEGIRRVVYEQPSGYPTVPNRMVAEYYGDNGCLSFGQIMVDIWSGYEKNLVADSNTGVFAWTGQKVELYTFEDTSRPVRIRFSEDMDALDISLYECARETYEKNFIFEDVTSFFNELGRRSYTYYLPIQTPLLAYYVYGWYFHVEILKTDHTAEVYGNIMYDYFTVGTLLNGYRITKKGKFCDLNKITVKDVQYVIIAYPTKVSVWGMVYQSGSWQNTGESAKLEFDKAENYAKYFYDNTTWNLYRAHPERVDQYLHKDLFTDIPKYSDGSLIPPDENRPSKFSVVQVTNMEMGDMIPLTIESLADLTLRDLQSAVFEMNCQYGKLDRTSDLFDGVELNNSRLYPADNLYPANTRYPNGTSERSNPAMYSKLWADEGNVRSFRYLIITYKGTEDDGSGNLQEVEKRLQRTVNQNGTDDYNMSDNWLFKNLVWDDADIADYADAMVAKMQDITWFPFEMWCAGLPYIETGDELEINMSEGAYTSYVLKRNLKGIQNLQDEMMNGNLDIF